MVPWEGRDGGDLGAGGQQLEGASCQEASHAYSLLLVCLCCGLTAQPACRAQVPQPGIKLGRGSQRAKSQAPDHWGISCLVCLFVCQAAWLTEAQTPDQGLSPGPSNESSGPQPLGAIRATPLDHC